MSKRFALIGCGAAAGLHAPEWKINPELELAGIYDKSMEASRDFADDYGLDRSRVYSGIEKMVEETQPSVAVVCTWPSTHLEIVQKCIELEVDGVLCEKPLTPTSEEAEEMQSIVNQSNTRVMEGMIPAFHSRTDYLKELINGGKLGDLHSILPTFSFWIPDEDWRFQKKGAGGGVMEGAGCYCTFIANYLSGSQPSSVYCHFKRRLGTPDVVNGIINFENGVVGQFEASYRVQGMYQPLEVYGSNAKASLDRFVTDREGNLSTVSLIEGRGRDGSQKTRSNVFSGEALYSKELLNLFNAIAGKEKQLVSLEESVQNLKIIDACEKSWKSGKLVKFQ